VCTGSTTQALLRRPSYLPCGANQRAGAGRGARRSCEHSQSVNATSTVCTAPLSACGGGAAGGALADEDDAMPFATGPGGACATALPGRAPSAAVSSRHAFSCVNQSVRCSSLRAQPRPSASFPQSCGQQACVSVCCRRALQGKGASRPPTGLARWWASTRRAGARR